MTPPDDDTPARGHGSRHGVGVIAVAFAFLMVMAFSTSPSPLYGLYKVRDGFSSFTITLIYAAYAIGVIISLFFLGHVSDWYGRKRVLVPAVVLSVVSAVVFLFWRALPGLYVGRIISGLSVGMVTATATAYLGELYAVHRPSAGTRRSQLLATTANLGGLGIGALLSGLLAEYVGAPLTVPFVVFGSLLTLSLFGVLASPETRAVPDPRPRYRPQRISVPREERGRFFASALGGMLSFAAFGLFTGLAGTILTTTLHQRSLALIGLTVFLVFGAGVVAQLSTRNWTVRRTLAAGIVLMLGGLGLIVLAAWLPTPSLAVFLVGGALTGAGAGAVFKGTIGTVVAISTDESRAEALAGLFLAAYVGLSIPIVGLGVALLHFSPKATLLGFAVIVSVAILVAAPTLLGPGDR
jgi:MFS family permease